MALNIISNYAANVAHRNLMASDAAATRSLAKLSSGLRVVSARDDAASMAIGARLNATAQALKMAAVNVGQANSMLQIADGGMSTIDDVLVRMKTLAVQASSGNLSDTERGFLNDEFTQLRDEINRISSSTNFNGIQLLGDGGDVDLNSADFNAGGQAEDINAANGFDNIAIMDNNYWARDTNDNGVGDNNFTVQFVKVGNSAMLQVVSVIDGAQDRTQSIDITDYATGGSNALEPGAHLSLTFDELGLSFDLNSNIGGIISDTLTLGSDGAGADGFATPQVIGGGALAGDNSTVSMLADNGQKIADSISFQVGAGNTANDRLSIALNAVDADTLGKGSNGSGESLEDLGVTAITTAAGAQNAVEVVTRAIDDLQRARAAVGTAQNRLDFAAQNLATMLENVEEARSTLMDLDVAAEMTNFTSKQILVQSGIAMLAQANQMPQALLRLLQG
ncbi:flagellin [Thalassospira sp. MA62]|nr:flagellin [Thalassospira sp. MA62]